MEVSTDLQMNKPIRKRGTTRHKMFDEFETKPKEEVKASKKFDEFETKPKEEVRASKKLPNIFDDSDDEDIDPIFGAGQPLFDD